MSIKTLYCIVIQWKPDIEIEYFLEKYSIFTLEGMTTIHQLPVKTIRVELFIKRVYNSNLVATSKNIKPQN